MTRQMRLLAEVDAEITRIVQQGQGPALQVRSADPDNPDPAEIDLIIDCGDERVGDVMVKTVVCLGSFFLVPELVAHLHRIRYVYLGGRANPLLYSLQEFSSDTPICLAVSED